MKPKKWDGLILICVAAFLLIFVFDMKNTAEKARTYPMVLMIAAYALIIVGLIIWFKAYRNGEFKNVEGLPPKRIAYMAVYCAAILLYIFLIDKLGYLVSTALFGIYSLIYMKNKNKIVIIVLPIVTALLMYFLFKNFLFVRLPKGILKNIL